MKRVSVWTTAALMAALVAIPATAQGPMGMGGMGGPGMGPGGDPARRLEHLATVLDLTDAQKSAATSLFATAKTQSEPLVASLRTGNQEVQAAVKANKSDAEIETLTANNGNIMGQLAAIAAKTQRGFYALLTPAQKEKLDALRTAGRRPGRGPSGQGRGPAAQ